MGRKSPPAKTTQNRIPRFSQKRKIQALTPGREGGRDAYPLGKVSKSNCRGHNAHTTYRS